MGIYSFEKRFVPFIKARTKQHTIRDIRKYPDKPGNVLHLYQALRTKQTKLIMRVTCVKIEEIIIESLTKGTLPDPRDVRVSINGIQLNESEREHLARCDGFENFKDMIFFWVRPKGRKKKSRLPFRGHIIHWK